MTRSLGGERPFRSVVVVTALALVARLVALGSRVAHFDEARVAYWTLEYARTGEYSYRAVIHGPLLQHVNRRLFDVFGATDFAIRLFPAVVGGLLPLAALLFRDRLSDREVTALALLLAFEPLLLYYARFSRNDVLVGAFCFVAFGLLVRATDTGRSRYLVPAVGLVALGVGAKENALLYPVAWLGALLLLADGRLLASEDQPATLRSFVRAVRAAGSRARPAIAPALALAVAILFVVYAPRAPGPGVGIGDAVGNPALLPAVAEAAFVENAGRMADLWLKPNHAFKREFSYVALLGGLLKDLLLGAAPVTLVGFGGFVVDRYRSPSRPVVQFAGLWALLSVIGYPAVADIAGPWLGVHVLLPLAVPAAVALVAAFDAARVRSDIVGRGAILLLVVVAVSVAGMGGYTSYAAPNGQHELAQYSQPNGEFGPLREGPSELLVYGEPFVDGDAEAVRRPACIDWFATLPLPWYVERADTTVSCATAAGGLPDRLPPVVVAPPDALDGELGRRTAGWDRQRVTFRQNDAPAVILTAPASDRATDRTAADRIPKR